MTNETDAKSGIVRFTPQEPSATAGHSSRWGMARKLRVEYLGAIYHAMNRGDRRESIVKDDADRERFVETRMTAGGIADPSRMGSVAIVMNTLLDYWWRDK